jgi:hypothetical protein
MEFPFSFQWVDRVEHRQTTILCLVLYIRCNKRLASRNRFSHFFTILNRPRFQFLWTKEVKKFGKKKYSDITYDDKSLPPCVYPCLQWNLRSQQWIPLNWKWFIKELHVQGSLSFHSVAAISYLIQDALASSCNLCDYHICLCVFYLPWIPQDTWGYWSYTYMQLLS